MTNATLTSKGQITIPKEVREAAGLKTGHQVSFRVREDGVVEMIPENVDLMSLCGIVKPAVRGITLKDMKEAVLQALAHGCEAVATLDGDLLPEPGFLAP